MTVDDYIDNNLPFFHITDARNKDSILQNGILANKGGICVVRTLVPQVIKYIVDEQLSGGFDNPLTGQKDIAFSGEYIIFKISPLDKGITSDNIVEDGQGYNTSLTSPLHNYIKIKEIVVSEDDIVKQEKQTSGIANLDGIKIEPLTGYHQKPNVYISDELQAILDDWS